MIYFDRTDADGAPMMRLNPQNTEVSYQVPKPLSKTGAMGTYDFARGSMIAGGFTALDPVIRHA